MLKIEKIDFVEVEYDKSLSHDICAVAKVYFNDKSSIDGVLIYYPYSYNEKEDYLECSSRSWHYDVRVKFPITLGLENELLEKFAYEIIDEYEQFTFREESKAINEKLLHLTESEWKEQSKVLHVYWLDKYFDKIDISIACGENENLTEDFIRKHLHRMDFQNISKIILYFTGCQTIFGKSSVI